MKLFLGDCLDVLRTLPDNSVDSIVSDPPYGLRFMSAKWDYDVPSVEVWRECLRVLKPGGHLLAFAGSRTYHRMAVNIEDAGFCIRDQIMWVYSTGFPKSLNISKAIDKAVGVEPIDLGQSPNWRESKRNREKDGSMEVRGENAGRITAPATPEAKQWEGWGSALKPAHEPIVVARKPLIGTIVENVLEHGTGGLNIDGCRVKMTEDDRQKSANNWKPKGYELKESVYEFGTKIVKTEQPKGRFPPNLIHDGSDEVVSLFPNSKGGGNNYEVGDAGICFGVGERSNRPMAHGYNDDGSAARFFYCAKASRKEREAGLEGFAQSGTVSNHHPTVKPIALMRYLCRLITPPNGVVLDPFMGSGTTGIAAGAEGFDFIGIEREAEYMRIAEARIAHGVCAEEVVASHYKTLDEWL